MNWNVTAEKVYGDLWAYYWSLFWWRAWSWWKWTMFLHRSRIVFELLAWQRSLRSLATWCLWWQLIVSCETTRIGSRNGIRAKISLPMAWHVKRLCVIGASLLVIGVDLLRYTNHKSTDKFTRSNWYDSNGSWPGKRTKKVDQVLDTITPNDKKSEEIHFTLGTCHQEVFLIDRFFLFCYDTVNDR